MDNKQFKEIEPMIKKLAGEIAKGDEFLYEELCQEGAIAALEAHKRYVVVEGADIKTYLYKTVKFEMIKKLNKGRKNPIYTQERNHLSADTVVGKDESNDPINVTDKASYDAWVDSERDQAKSEVINEYINSCGLTKKQKLYLRLNVIDGLKQREIAERLNRDASTVGEVIRTAKAKIKSKRKYLESLNLVKEDK